MYDMKECVRKDNKTVNLITVISIYLVLLGMTKNWFMPVLLILAIQCSIWVNMSVPYFMGSKLSYLCYLIVSTVRMGATVDYAIILTDTYQERRMKVNKKRSYEKYAGKCVQFHSGIRPDAGVGRILYGGSFLQRDPRRDGYPGGTGSYAVRSDGYVAASHAVASDRRGNSPYKSDTAEITS